MNKLLREYPWVLLFALFIAVYTCVDMTQTTRERSELENRSLAKRPKLSWSVLMDGSYDEKYDKYINDQFVGRDGWITLKSVSESALGKQENNGVVYGKDGYLFRKFTSVDAEVPGRFAENAAYLREFCEMYPDQPITMMIAPTAYEILPDKRPFGLTFADQRAELDKLHATLPANVTPLPLFDALGAHRDAQLYYRTDHHWTTEGAYWAAQAYARSKGMDLPPLDSIPSHRVEGFYGTNFSTSKKIGTPSDTLTYYDVPVTSVTIDGEERGGLYDLPKLDTRDKYAAFLWGNNNLTELRAQNGGKPSRVLLVKDSYGNCFAPFLTYLYNEVDVADLRFLNGLSGILKEREYDDVIVLYNFESLAKDGFIPRLRY